jgi:flagellar basal body-associated protein FliL
MVIRKAPLNIVMIVILLVIAILFLLSWLVFPVYTVTTEGSFDPSSEEGPQGDFKVTEKYYLNNYEASSETHPMFDTDNDGVPDSKQSLKYSYSDEPDLGDGKTGNNYGWAGSVEDGGQPAKARVYSTTFYTMVAVLILAGLMMIIVPLGGPRVTPMVFANMVGFLLLLSCILFPMILGMGLPGAYETDDRDSFGANYSDTGLSYKPPGIGDTYMGEIKSQSAGGKEYTYYADPEDIPSAASTQESYVLDEDPAARQWNTYFGAQAAAGYSHSEGGATTDANVTYVSVYLTKITYGPGGGWYLSVLAIFISIIGWIFSLVITGITAASLKKEEEEERKKRIGGPGRPKLVEPVVVKEVPVEKPVKKKVEKVNIQCPGCNFNFPQDKNSKTIKCPKCGLRGELE